MCSITREMVDQGVVIETQPHSFCAEASCLGLPPGHVPSQIGTDLGNGMPFFLQRFDDVGVHYSQAAGCVRLTVFND
jgi:hypothetical protein